MNVDVPSCEQRRVGLPERGSSVRGSLCPELPPDVSTSHHQAARWSLRYSFQGSPRYRKRGDLKLSLTTLGIPCAKTAKFGYFVLSGLWDTMSYICLNRMRTSKKAHESLFPHVDSVKNHHFWRSQCNTTEAVSSVCVDDWITNQRTNSYWCIEAPFRVTLRIPADILRPPIWGQWRCNWTCFATSQGLTERKEFSAPSCQHIHFRKSHRSAGKTQSDAQKHNTKSQVSCNIHNL